MMNKKIKKRIGVIFSVGRKYAQIKISDQDVDRYKLVLKSDLLSAGYEVKGGQEVDLTGWVHENFGTRKWARWGFVRGIAT